jgi:hypothetical protein
MQTSRISLYICFPSHTRKPMHTNTCSTKSISKSSHTSQCYALCFVFLFLCFQGYNIRSYNSLDLLFLRPGAQTLWNLLFPPMRLQRLCSFSVHEFIILVLQHYLCSLFMLSHMQIITSHALFTTHYYAGFIIFLFNKSWKLYFT